MPLWGYTYVHSMCCVVMTSVACSTWKYEAELGQHPSTHAVIKQGSCLFSVPGITSSTNAAISAVEVELSLPSMREVWASRHHAAKPTAAAEQHAVGLSLSSSYSLHEDRLPALAQLPTSTDGWADDKACPAAASGKEGFLAGLPTLQPVGCQLLSSERAEVDCITPRMPANLGGAGTHGPTLSSTGGETDDVSCSRLVQVSAQHIGTYAFKGCGAMDMVCLTTDGMLPEATAHAAGPAKGAKGMSIFRRCTAAGCCVACCA